MKPIYAAFLSLLMGFQGCATAVDPEMVRTRTEKLYGQTSPAPLRTEAAQDGARAPIAATAVEDYVRHALLNNAGLRSAFDQWRAALERVPQATALPDPQFTFTNFIEEVQTRTGPQNNRFQLSQKFPWYGKLRERGDVAEEHAEAVWWAVEGRALSLARDVKVAYYEYAYLRQALRIVEENLALLTGLEPIVQRRVQTGASQSELLRLQVEIGKVENEADSLRERRPLMMARLNALLNQPPGAELPWPELRHTEAVSYEAEALRARLVQANPELRALDHRIGEAEERRALARFDGYPDITIGVGIIDTREAVTMPRPAGSGNDPVSLSIGLNLPIWRYKYAASKREALAAKDSAMHTRTQRRNDLLSQLELALYKFDDAARQIGLYRATLIPRARQALKLTEISYESGGAALLDVIDSQRELLAFEKSYWSAVRDYQQQSAHLEALCGGTLS